MALANATLTDSAATVFTANSAKTFLTASVGLIVCKNHDSSARTITVHACPAGEAAADENMLFEVSVPAGDTYTFSEKLLLANTDVIKAFASVTSVCSVTVSYLDI